ncbi:ATP synthase F1 subunit gamma [Candidatus Tisiphia endosymbiont of Beris chalybata]|uniref:ATP synthase F1 subunit gamma n=1 Tax=Candidatus Tisiphia endosymbiont of Beris chalybata TaxID=3066262 RepID=UPI00312CB0B3
MSNLKQLRSRIKSIKTTQKITKAMQLVSATKFTKAKNQVKNSEAYIETLHKIIGNIATENNLQDMDEKDKKFFLGNPEKPYLLIIITSERGLCGSFNFSVTKLVKADIENLKNSSKEIKIIVIGKKGYDIIKGGYGSYIDSYYDFPKFHTNDLSLKIIERLMNMIEAAEIGSCQIYFNKCKNAMVQLPSRQQIFPVTTQLTTAEDKYLSYEYEGADLIFNLFKLYISSQINYALLHSRASEEGARMTSMDNATKNANELIDNLTLKLNKSRQDLITNELIEIIAGVGAL